MMILNLSSVEVVRLLCDLKNGPDICTCISHSVNMYEQVGGLVWYTLGIIFASHCDGDLWLLHFYCIPFDPITSHCGEGNHHCQVIQL